MDWTVIGGILGTILTGGGAWYAARRTGKSTKEATAVTWSKDLVTRIETLERRDEEKNKRIDDLQEKQRETASMFSASLGYIEDLVQDIRAAGVKLVRRPPSELRDRLSHLFPHETKREG